MIMVDMLMHHGWEMRGRTVMSCHLICDGDLNELHAFATSIGMKRRWFQPHGAVPHYDLVESKREQAVAAGAIELDRRQIVEWIRRWRWWRG
jgi:hypothetical protein